MRPLKLAIEGFTAFRDLQEVDFGPLELFVITGPTGAGKTSILDAIAFALYGEVPRLGGTKGTADVISLGKMLANVEFEFSIQNKGRYRIARRISRRANQPQTLTFECWDGSAWVPACEGGVRETNKRITEIVGLDFEGFTRAVLLPQGEFHRFLKGDIGERRKVLFSLLGVFYFQKMATTARNRKTILDARVRRTDELLAEQYADATPENVERLRTVSANAAESVEAVSDALADANRHGKAAADAKARLAVADAGRRELEELTSELLALSEKAKAAEAEHAEIEERLATNVRELENARTGLTAAQQEADAIEAEVGSLDQIAEAAAAAHTLAGTVEQEKRGVQELAAAAEEAETRQQALKTAISEEATSMTELTTTREAEAAALAAATERTAASEAIARSLVAARTAEVELRDAEQELLDHKSILSDASREAEAVHDLLTAALNALEEHRRIHAVAELAEDLQPGDPCPVSGVALAAAVLIEDDATTALETARASEEEARARSAAADRALAQAEMKLSSLEAKRDDCVERMEAALDGQADSAALAKAAQTAEDAAAAAKGKARGLTDERVGRERDHQELTQAVSDARVASTRAEERRDAMTAALEEICKRRDAANALLRERFGGEVPPNAAEQIAAQRERLRTGGDAVRVARGRCDQLSTDQETIREQVAASQKQLAAIDVNLARIRTLAQGGHARLVSPPLRVALDELPDRLDGRATAAIELATWCTSATQQLAAARNEADAEATRSGNAVITLASAQGVEASDPELALELLTQAQKEALKEAATAEAALAEGERRVAQRIEMEAQTKEERDQIVVLDALARELQVDHFGAYIVEETLDLLAARASEELLQISGGRYSLKPVDGEFKVVDRANADELRSVKTLSGGETFLASLALALALSRHVGDMASDGMGAKLESVFIDEGFGTLDPATLDEVIDALERLREQELIVGVISHVPELAQRIQTGLSVEPVGGRSRIVPVGAE